MSVHDEVRALRAPLPRRVRTVMPYVLLATLIVVLFVMPRLYGKTVSIFNVYDSLQYWSAYGLVALGLGLTMIAGEFDFSVLGIFAACPMIAVKVGEHGALLGLVVALGIAAVVGFLEGVIIARLRINSMAVTLGFYIALLGVSVTIANDETVSYSDYNVGSMLDATKLRILSWSSIIAIVVFAIVVVVMHYTHIGRDVRAVGGDRRASRTVGVEVDRVLIGVFVTSAVCSALGGVLLAYSLATAVPDPGLTPLNFAIAAVLLGGVSLTGGSGDAVGIAAGALTLSVLQELFSIFGGSDYISDTFTGAVLLVATIIAAPELSARWKSLRAPRARRADADAAPLPVELTPK